MIEHSHCMDKNANEILISDGFRTILAKPIECAGCHVMHFYFQLTSQGHRCLSCARKDPLAEFLEQRRRA
jgi:hypothetical protein